MALHGALAVNSVIIGGWQARRMEPLKPDRDLYTYACQIDRFASPSEPGSRFTFTVQHYYSQGAIALAARVLAKAAEWDA